MSAKNDSRLRRARRARARMRGLGVNRLSVHRTPRHIYAQVIAPAGDKVLASASTLDSELRKGATGNITAAAEVGKLVAKRAKEAGVEQVAFDRSGYKYHGRVKALADAARESGLEF
ncbi:50S ribosomal protein L18 [Candidatus Marimicrobium litorale]|jgi:large subunit ribosomal protein L18|uniref:Large ribosomal subunit protein uL18 n=1 Tax=Candidatus Marimicrobium litorale TaxID=2518991 RepID=A0ABT3T5A5_9GAMM|nr:50S ribosomal protein L18 [Candidatus Marimicrobium litorale]MCX2977471.1 50S ribosomal protein L18 [Candidatus Marimicrobium litorale]